MPISFPNSPTIIYPNGGESLINGEIAIRWLLAEPLDPQSRIVSYEIYYTEQYDSSKEPDWKQIATVPETAFQYVWRFGNSIRSEKCRIAVVARNSRGQKSKWSISADNFLINRRKLESPNIIAPNSGERFDKYINIITDNSAIIGTYSERSFYQFYFSSSSANIPLTSIAQNIAIGSVSSILWKTINLPPATDYVIHSYLSDDDGNVSASVFIRDIEISHEGFFIIDTKPPEASIVINSNATFTQSRDVTVSIVSYDDATSVHSMQLKEGENSSVSEKVADIVSFRLSEGDEIKSVELLLQDYGANRNNQETKRLFETIIEVEGNSIVDIALDKENSTSWAITSQPSNHLYKIKLFPSIVATFEENLTAVSVFGSFVYIGTKRTEGTGSLMKYNGYESVVEKNFTEADSIINSMCVHKKKLYIGFENGMVYTFDGLVFVKLIGVNIPINSLVSNGNSLYMTEKNGTNVYFFNGVNFQSLGV